MTRTLETLAAQRAALVQVEVHEAELSAMFARRMRDRALVAELWTGERSGFVEMELAGTALVGQVRAARELEDAVRLTELFPNLLGLLEAGAVFVPSAELLLRETRRCTDEVQLAVDARVSPQLVGLNTTDARKLVARTILAVEADLDPMLTEQRLDNARKGARVWSGHEADGMMSVGAILDAVDGRRWSVDFEQLVRAQQLTDKREGLERTADQVRAAVFASLPTLVLELCRAARDGRLSELAAVAELDPEAALELQQLAFATSDLPLPDPGDPTDAEHDVSGVCDVGTGEVVVVPDPYDEATAEQDPHADLAPAEGADPGAGPEQDPYGGREWVVPPDVAAAQDAAHGSTTGHAQALTGSQVDELVLRCLMLPLAAPTVVNLHIPMATVLGLSTAPGELDGYGPLHASRILALMPGSQLNNVYVDEVTGVPLGTRRQERTGPGTLSDLLARIRPVVLEDEAEAHHDPSKALVDLVRLRDVTCGGPGCTMRACRCHLDHETAWPEGPTAAWNLNPKSPRCHQAKHHGWTAERHDDGTQTWTSPTGRTYRKPSPWTPPPLVGRPWNVEYFVPAQQIELSR